MGKRVSEAENGIEGFRKHVHLIEIRNLETHLHFGLGCIFPGHLDHDRAGIASRCPVSFLRQSDGMPSRAARRIQDGADPILIQGPLKEWHFQGQPF